jgi:membrane protein implicated in regulation of membrane protease activity
VADNPQQTVRELRELVIAYAKQEAADPLTGLKRYAGFGLSGAVLIGTGVFFLAIGALRAMQQYGGWLVHGNYSWVPYFAVVIVLVILAALIWAARARRQRKVDRSHSS